jgi:hypothetical protein
MGTNGRRAVLAGVRSTGVGVSAAPRADRGNREILMASHDSEAVGARATSRIAVLLLCAVCLQCSGSNTPVSPTGSRPNTPGSPPIPNNPTPGPTGPPAAPETFAGAGDIARCNNGNAAGVARLLDTVGGTIFTLGDNVYMNGTANEFRDCYEPTWGRHKGRTRPTPGNHDYGTPGASSYFDYFGPNAGPYGLGYYSFPMVGGAWHVISLNSEISTALNSPQGVWLQADLRATSARCILAYWHRPLFSSGPNGSHPHLRDFWRLLYDHGADVILAGHDHLYERFGPQDADGRPDVRSGIRQFIVGTGGVPLYDFRPSAQPNSIRQIKQHGILKMTLAPDSYQWEFIPVSNTAIERDFGLETCH